MRTQHTTRSAAQGTAQATPTGHRSPAAALTAGACLLALALVAPGYSASGATHAPASAAKQLAGQRLVANLKGGSQADKDGTGRATFRLFKSAHKVCANVTWKNIGKPTAAHIHRPDGQVVVDLSGSVTGGAHCTTKVSKALVGKILANPGKYYFNVHNAKFPAGAIRGNLHH